MLVRPAPLLPPEPLLLSEESTCDDPPFDDPPSPVGSLLAAEGCPPAVAEPPEPLEDESDPPPDFPATAPPTDSDGALDWQPGNARPNATAQLMKLILLMIPEHEDPLTQGFQRTVFKTRPKIHKQTICCAG